MYNIYNDRIRSQIYEIICPKWNLQFLAHGRFNNWITPKTMAGAPFGSVTDKFLKGMWHKITSCSWVGFPLVSKLEDNSRGRTAVLDQFKFSSGLERVLSIYRSLAASLAFNPLPLAISLLAIIQIDWELGGGKTMEIKKCFSSKSRVEDEVNRSLLSKHLKWLFF